MFLMFLDIDFIAIEDEFENFLADRKAMMC